MQPRGTIKLRRTGPNSAAVESIRSGPAPFPATGAAPETASAGTQASEIQPRYIAAGPNDPIPGDPCIESSGAHFLPEGWIKGQLLNVRNNGAEYVVTLLGEEFDPRYPHRALKFPHAPACQAFVSSWYSREHSDPRAL